MTTPRHAYERGAIAAEMAVVMVTFFAGFLLLVVFAGRVAQAENDVRSAAHEAARAATLQGTPDAADARAREVAAANLTTSGVACSEGTTVTVGLTDWRPGGWVTVTVTCNASLRDVASLGVPGTRTFTATATEIIGTFRSTP